MSHYSFKPSWFASIVFVGASALFISLSVWQWHRAEEKKVLIEQREQRSREAPMQLKADAGLDLDALRYRPVWLEGDYDAEHQFLLDNQMHGQMPGYHVLTPLQLASGKAVLVNRGWVPLGRDRRELPVITINNTHGRVAGVLDRLHRVGFRLKGAEIPASGWPSLLQLPDPERMAERLGYPLIPYQVLLDPAADGGYLRDWQEARLEPGKNLGYALQWFLFAVCAAILYVRHGLKAGAHE